MLCATGYPSVLDSPKSMVLHHDVSSRSLFGITKQAPTGMDTTRGDCTGIQIEPQAERECISVARSMSVTSRR